MLDSFLKFAGVTFTTLSQDSNLKPWIGDFLIIIILKIETRWITQQSTGIVFEICE
jgi:hypothetical protein